MAHAAIELYEALKEAGTSDEKARMAAEAIEEIRDDDRFHRLDDRMERLENRIAKVENEVSDLKAEVKITKWMVAFVLAANMAIFWLLIKMALAHGG